MLAPLFFTNIFGQCGNKEGNYIRYSMLDFPLFMVVPSEYSYSTMENI